MEKLDLLLLSNKLTSLPDASFIDTAPEGFTEDFFNKFLSVLKAKEPDDVADVTDDELIQMLLNTDDLFKHMCFESFYDEALMREFFNTKSVKKKARVL